MVICDKIIIRFLDISTKKKSAAPGYDLEAARIITENRLNDSNLRSDRISAGKTKLYTCYKVLQAIQP